MKETQGYLLIATASLLWGTMGILGKLAFAYGIDPLTLIGLRVAISSGTMLALITVFMRRLLRVERKDLLRLLLFGIFAVALQRVTYFYAVELLTPTLAAVLFYTYPVFITVYASVFLHEKMSLPTVGAMVLSLSGVALVVKAYSTVWLGQNLLGMVFGVLSSVLFVFYFLMVKRLRGNYTNWTLLFYGDGFGAMILSPVLWLHASEIVSFPQQLWVLIVIIALLPSLVAYLLFSYALKYVASSKGSILSIVEPMSAAVLSSAFLGEKFEPLQLVGVIFALVGISLVFWKPSSQISSDRIAQQ